MVESTSRQILCYKVKKRPTLIARTIQHYLESEPPLPLLMEIYIQKKFQSQRLVIMQMQMQVQKEISRVLQLEKRIASSLCKHMKKIVP